MATIQSCQSPGNFRAADLKPLWHLACDMNLKWFAVLILGAALFAEPSPAQEKDASDGLNALVQVLTQSDDPQLQYDVLKGMSEGLKGRRGLKMPIGWEELAVKLSQSPNAQL